MNDLAYFISLMEKETEPSPNIWDRRARSWAHERKNNRKTDERLEKDFLFLENHGLLKKDFSVADIGCGPGRFAAAFASRVRFVTALDISGEMIAQGKEYAKSLGLTNLQFHLCDFDTLDLKKEGFKRAFDLVFVSLTPAVRKGHGNEPGPLLLHFPSVPQKPAHGTDYERSLSRKSHEA